MSRIQMLNGVARNISHKFSVSANHFAYMAYLNKVGEITIDLLLQTIKPSLFSIDRNLNLVMMCKESLLDTIERLNLQAININKAQLIVRFDISAPIHGENFPDALAAVFETTLSDTRGKQFGGTVQTSVIMQR